MLNKGLQLAQYPNPHKVQTISSEYCEETENYTRRTLEEYHTLSGCSRTVYPKDHFNQF